MLDKIKGTLDFIVWENFTDPMVYFLWIKSLLFIFSFLFVSLILSNLILNKESKFHSKVEEFVLRSALGISISSFILSFLGFIHLLYAWAYFGAIFSIFIYFVIKDKSVFLQTIQLFGKILKEYYPLWLLFLISSLPSLLPPRWTDETHYHLVYPLKWVKEGAIYVEESMRFPLYAFNFHVLHSISFFLDTVSFSHFLSWLSGILTTLGIFSFTQRFNVWKPLKYIASLAFFFTPVVQQYLNISYHDLPLMFFLFSSAYFLVLTFEDKENRHILISAAIVSAMFVGMKITNAIYVPLIFVLFFYKKKFKTILPALILFSILGSFWYIRNLIIDGDPIPPTLNMFFGNEDLFWTKADYEFQVRDIKPKHDWGWAIFYKLPIELLNSGAGRPLLYWPHLGFTLLFPFSLIYFIKNRKNETILALGIFVFFAFFIWLSTSYFSRYAHFLALAAVSSALFLNFIYSSFEINNPNQKWIRYLIVSLFIFVMIGPKFSAYSYYKNNFNSKIPTNTYETYQFVGWFSEPYLLELVDNLEKYNVKKGDGIYLMGMLQYKYYFEKAGYPPVGDGLSVYRYSDLYKALDNNKIKDFFNTKIKHLLIDKTYGNLSKNEQFKTNSDLKIVFENERFLLLSLKQE